MRKLRCLVTGGAGFIGSHLVDALLEAGHTIAVVDNLSYGRREQVNPGARFYEADILGPLREILERERPEIVFHFAAQISVARSTHDPAFDARTNIEGSINVLEECVRTGVKRVIYASSAAVYGEQDSLPLREDQVVYPLSPYGISKYTVEYYLNYHRRATGLEYFALRFANVYGPRQDPHGEAGVVAIFSQRLLQKQEAVIFGDGEQTRDFVYVADVAKASLLAMDAPLPVDCRPVFNISSAQQTTVNEIFRLVRLYSASQQNEKYGPPRPGDVYHSYLANDLAGKYLAWQPSTSLEDGLRKTVNFFKSRLDICR